MKLFLRCDDNEVSYNKKNYLLRAQDRLGLTFMHDIKKREGDEPTDYILNIQPYDSLLKGNTWTGVWHIDILLNGSIHQDYPYCESVFVASTQGQCQYKYPNAITLFQAADTEYHRRYDIKPNLDFIICATNNDSVHDYRKCMYQELSKTFKGEDVGHTFRPWDFPKQYARAKVQFVCSGVNPLGKGNCAQRFFECIAIGPVLTNWTDDLPATGLIEDEDYLAFRDTKEMVEKMNLLIKDDELRERIFKNGSTKSLMYHTYEHRVISILNEVKRFGFRL